MHISNKGINFIKSFEGCYLRAYDDLNPTKVLKQGDKIKGTLTIRIGHTGNDVKIGKTITYEQAANLFKADVVRYEPKKDMKQCEFDALTSYRYNCGCSASTTWKNRNKKIYSRGIRLKGLERRRIAEMILHFKGLYITSMKPLRTYINTTNTFTYNQICSDKFLTMCVQWIVGTEDIDGIYGPLTKEAVKVYQKNHNLTVDGLAGVNTWNSFKKYCAI